MDIDDLPDSIIERVTMMEGILTAAATGGSPDNHVYDYLRREFMSDETLKPLLPAFVRTYRNLGAFWPYIKNEAGSYAERRQIISEAFTPIVEHLEGANRAPIDLVAGDTLASFDADGVHAVWAKALSRRASDPEGAITVARTLLETVCKRVLDERGVAYGYKDDLPKLYGLAARELNMAPDQHVEEPIKMILGGAMNLVNGIGTLRNRFSDAHAPGGKIPVKPSARHAALAVNMAGAMATFMIETFVQQDAKAAA
jgi:hypothetical protein